MADSREGTPSPTRKSEDSDAIFMTPPNESEQSVNLNVQKLYYGDAIQELDDEAVECLSNVSGNYKAVFKDDDEAR